MTAQVHPFPQREPPRYLGMAESNKLLRKTLAARFPGVKFSVTGRSYSGGSSTDVRWTDGPTYEQVNAIADQFAYKGFDGMIDMAYSYRQWLLPSGKIICAGTNGTVGSRGTVEAFDVERPAGAVAVSSGIGYVFCRREESPAFVEGVRKALERLSGQDLCTLINKSPRWPEGDDKLAERIAKITPAPAKR